MQLGQGLGGAGLGFVAEGEQGQRLGRGAVLTTHGQYRNCSALRLLRLRCSLKRL